jgi:hypothetical protein
MRRGAVMGAFSSRRLFIGVVATAVLSPLFCVGLAHSGERQIAFLAPGDARNNLILGANPQIHQVQGSITVAPNVVDTGTSPRVTISASGFFDLSEVTESQISIRPSQGVSQLQITGATAQHLTLSFDLAADASIGTRTLLIRNNDGATVVALDLVFRLGSHICRPPCELPFRCSANVCVGPPPPPPPPQCRPPCRPGFFCSEFGVCERAR